MARQTISGSLRLLLLALLVAIALNENHASAEMLSEEELLMQHKQMFAQFQSEFERVYASAEEEEQRFSNFRASIRRVEERNRMHSTDVFGITKFSDLSEEEFTARLSFNPDAERLNKQVEQMGMDTSVLTRDRRNDGHSTINDLPSYVDWREKDVVTKVNDQGQCGSCWAFSATETIESAYLLSHPWMRSEVSNGWGLSVEQVAACNSFLVFGGCNGGWADLAYEYVKKWGIVNASAMPYIGDSGDLGPCLVLASPVTFVSNVSWATPPCLFDCDHQDLQQLAQTVAQVSPVSICLNAGPFQDYRGGIIPSSSCSSGFFNMNHCVQLVGYSVNQTDPTQSYWLVRNSWGDRWGESGYVRMEFGSNTCGLADQATYVSVSHQPIPQHQENERMRDNGEESDIALE